jgi:hypothetical protein
VSCVVLCCVVCCVVLCCVVLSWLGSSSIVLRCLNVVLYCLVSVLCCFALCVLYCVGVDDVL